MWSSTYDRSSTVPRVLVVLGNLALNGQERGNIQVFNALKEAVDGVSSKVLSDSLENLEEHGLVDREIVSEKPFRVEYSLTERGRSLGPVIDAMREWGEEHLAAPAEEGEDGATA